MQVLPDGIHPWSAGWRIGLQRFPKLSRPIFVAILLNCDRLEESGYRLFGIVHERLVNGTACFCSDYAVGSHRQGLPKRRTLLRILAEQPQRRPIRTRRILKPSHAQVNWCDNLEPTAVIGVGLETRFDFGNRGSESEVLTSAPRCDRHIRLVGSADLEVRCERDERQH